MKKADRSKETRRTFLTNLDRAPRWPRRIHEMDLRSPPEDEIQHLASQLDKHTKPQLQSVCAINGLPKTGNKPDLKARIIKRK